MPVVGDGDEHGVDIGAGEDLPKIIGRRAAPVGPGRSRRRIGGFDRLFGRFPPIPVDVANRHDPHARLVDQQAKVGSPLAADPDDPEGDAIARRDRAEGGGAEQVRAGDQTGGGLGGQFEERAALHRW